MKHTFKKLLSALLVLTMLFSLLPSLALTASATNAVIAVGTQTAAAGDTVTVPITITGNPGFASFVFTPAYDATKLTLNSVEKGSAITSTSGSLLAGTNIVYGDSVNTTTDGEILTLNFTVSATATAGDYPITLALTDGDEENFCNAALAAVPVMFTAGKITVNAATPGAAETPDFTTDLSADGVTYTVDQTSAALSVDASVTDGGTVTYQWFSSADNSTFIEITGATDAGYTPSTAAAGTTYYYVVATNTLTGYSPASAASNVAKVTVSAATPGTAETPVFNTNLSTDAATYAVGEEAAALMVDASVTDGGTVTYQWYSNTTNSATGGTPVGTGASYTPSTASAGTTYYYAVATNTLDSSTASADSNVATVTVGTWSGEGTQANPYKIKTASDLANLAAYTNAGHTTKGVYWELVNDIDLSTVCGASVGSWTPIGALTITAAYAIEGYAFLGTFNGNGYKIQNLYISANADGLGLFGMIGGTDTPGAAGYGVVTNFKLYGSVTNTSTTDAATDFVGAACGKLNAGGTISYVVNYAAVNAKCTNNVGGIVGFAGTPVSYDSIENNYSSYTSNPSGYNTYILCCGNEAQIWGYYKLGGIVGENAATVMYCYNTGYILPHMHGSGGGWGGIAGRNGNNNTATEESVIAYCYNTGKITNDGYNDDKNETIKGFAGIAGKTYGGKGHNTVYNCYNIGEIPQGRLNSVAAFGSITTNLEAPNKDQAVFNNYSLDTDKINNADPQYIWETGIVISEAQFKTTTYGNSDILTLLGTAFTADTTNINGGYPILRWQVGMSMPTLSSISIATAPTKMAYDASEVFSPTGMVVIGTYSDGSKAVITDYTYPTTPLMAGTTSIDITCGALTATQAITVSALTLTDIAITTNPANLLYAADETFDRAGMVVTATYNSNSATNKALAYDETGAAGYTYSVDSVGLVTVSYTENAVTKTATLQLSSLASAAPTAISGVYQLDSADDMLWFANQVNAAGNTTLNAELKNSVNLGGVTWTPIGTSTKAYSGEFDGNNFIVTFNNTFTANYAGVFGYIGSTTVDSVKYTASIHDLKSAGTITASGKSYVAGIAGYVSGASVANCGNTAAISAAGSFGGIAGYAAAGSIFTDCANSGAITATSTYAAGIVGFATATTITRCVNSANISGSNTTAGIVCYADSNSAITYCTNSGAVTGTGTVGGICGSLSGTASKIQYCANTGSVTGTSSAVAGISGTGYGAIDNCYNTGAIRGTYYVGGIVGQNYSAALTNCYNLGTVTGTAGTSVYMASGGICGLGGTGSFANCYNAGAVTATYAGALVGASNNSVFTLTNCYYLTGMASTAYNERTTGKVIATNVGAVTAVQLAGLAATLGTAYKTGLVLPILTWQPSEVPVTDGAAAVTLNLASAQVTSGAAFTATATTGNADAEKLDLTFTAATLTALGSASSVIVHTDFCDITLDSAAVANLITNATGGSVTLTVEEKTAAQLPAGQQEAASDADVLLELSLTAGGGTVAFNNGTSGGITVVVPFTPSSEGLDVTVYYIDDAGNRTEMPSTCTDGIVTFTTTHLSLYAIEEEKSDYTVSLSSSDTDKNVGETVSVGLNVTGADAYASLEAVVAYDKDKVSYAGNSLTGFTVTNHATDGTLTITHVGDTITTGLQGSLSFTVKSDIVPGSAVAEFSVTSAEVGIGADSSDIPEANTGTAVTVSVHNLTVAFAAGSHVTMTAVTAYAKYGVAGLYTSNDYKTALTAPSPVADTGYTLDTPLWSDGTNRAAYATIAATALTASAAYTATATLDVYTITYMLDGGTNNAANPAAYSYGDSFTLADPTKTNYTFGGWFKDAVFTQAATGVSATDTGNKAFYAMWQGEVAVTLPSQATAVSGVTSGKANYGTPIVFTVAADPGYTLVSVSYKVGAGSDVTMTASGSQYTIPGTVLTGAVTVTVTQQITGSAAFITFDDYKGAPEGFKVLLLAATAPDGYMYQYDGTTMLYSAKYGKYACFVSSDIDASAALSNVACVAGTAPAITYDGNVNQSTSGKIDVVDAQLVYDLYTGTYLSDTFVKASAKMRLAADLNGDGTVDTSDVQIIINIIHGVE